MTRIISKNMLHRLKAGEVETFTIGSRSDLYKAAWDQGYRVGLESAQPKWISVEERLPGPYFRYIVAIKLKYDWETEWKRVVDVACMVPEGGYIEGQWDTFNDWDEGQEIHVTHWMPLPDLPKEDV